MRAPTSIRIAGRTWKVRRKSAAQMGESAGLCHYGKAELDVLHRQPPFDSRDTLLHEVLHAILMRHGFERTVEVEEAFVNPIATELIGVLQDNPEFAQWLSEPIL